MGGVSMDLWKFYDLIDAPVAIEFLKKMGLSDRVAKPLHAFYDKLWRIMSLNGAAGAGFRSIQSVLQGCAWSNPLAASIGTAWACFVEQQAKVAA